MTIGYDPEAGLYLFVIGVGKARVTKRYRSWRQAKNAGERLRRKGVAQWAYPDQHYFG